jgi:hypothetical protein
MERIRPSCLLIRRPAARLSGDRGTGVAWLEIMKIKTKLLLLGGLVGSVMAINRKRRLRGQGASAKATDQMGVAPDVVIIEAEIIGLADVDPVALTQMGEAIDPELTRAAHEEIPEQRARMPVRGKNVP